MKQLKSIKTLFLSAAVAGLAVMAGCDDAEYSALGTQAYFDEATSSTSAKVTVPVTGEASTSLSIHLSTLSSQDNHYTLAPDQTVLDEYNRINGTGYIMLPEGFYTLPGDVVVKAGEYNAEPVTIVLKSFSEEMMKSGESYALPLRLSLKSGDASAMATTGTFVVLAESIIEFSAPMFTGAPVLKAAGFDEAPETYSQYTVEVRFQVENTGNRDRAVFKNGSDDTNFILLRFEDPNYDSSEFELHSLVQVVGRNRLYLNPSRSFEPNKWQHLALVCDGSSYKLYINGADSGTMSIPAGATTFSDVYWFCVGDDPNYGWGNCKILMSEARIWSVARTASQIQNNMTQVSPKSAGLEAYWRFNEGTGSVFIDATGNGHDLTSEEGAVPQWIDGVLSTDTSTPWPTN